MTLADTVKANGSKIRVNANSNPEINDWNEDGKKDLIVGEQSYVSPNTGNIRVYLNYGTNAAPVFTTYTVLTSGGSQIYHYRVNPRVYDLDQDGFKDLIVGQNDGRLYFYKNVGTNANPQFNGYELLRQTNNTIIDAYAGSRFCFTDWKGDGYTDFLVSGYDGYIDYYENATLGSEEEKSATLLDNFSLKPNPVRSAVVISYSLKQTALVKVDVFSPDGRLSATPLKISENAGKHQFTWNVDNLVAGVYFVRITAGADISTTRMIVVR